MVHSNGKKYVESFFFEEKKENLDLRKGGRRDGKLVRPLIHLRGEEKKQNRIPIS